MDPGDRIADKVLGGPQHREYEQIADRLAADAPGRVLDWGCGLGQVSALLAARGLDLTSYDFRPDEPEGRRRLEHFPELEYDVGHDPVGLPYGDASFDAVLSCGVLEHVQFPSRSLVELHRVLRPGGTLYVYKLPNRFSWTEQAGRLSGNYFHGQLPFDRTYTPASARALVTGAGFEVVELRLANILPMAVTWDAVHRHAQAVWDANVRLAKLPGLRRLATNVELVARRLG